MIHMPIDDSERLSLRQRMALGLWRIRESNMRKEHPLQQLFWECTLRCNLHCRHCGSDCKAVAGRSDMPAGDFYRVLDNVASHKDPHTVFVVVSGGEPLVRDDIEEVCSGIYHRGFPWGMVTNGLYLTPDRYNGLLKAGLRSITVSLDGLEEDHNWMRGHKDSFNMVNQALSMFVATPGLTFDVVTCVTRRSYPHLQEIKEYLIGKGVRHWRIFTVFPTGRAATDPVMRLNADEFRGVFRFIQETRKEKRIHLSYGCEGFLGGLEGKVRDHFFTCQAGITVGGVLVDGSITACTSIRSDYHQGNIYKDDFMDVWEHRYIPYRNHDWMRTDECTDCKFWSYCQGGGMHLRDSEGKLMLCHVKRLKEHS